MSYTYKNLTDRRLEIIGVGVVEADDEITTDQKVYNPNLKLVKTKSDKKENV